MTLDADHQLDSVLSLLEVQNGFDLTGYRRSSLERRIRARARLLGLPVVREYVAYLQQQPSEPHDLFDTMFVRVTSFFRDPQVWTTLAHRVLSPLAARARAGQHLRIWNPGCANGEETHTLLMLLEKVMGPDLLRQRVSLIATDVDQAALDAARTGAYDGARLDTVPPPWRATYFRWSGNRFELREDLRDVATFRRHDLLRDEPIPGPDLVVCRNTLLYFDADTQRRVLERIYDVLGDGACLVVGRSEMLLAHTDLFRAVHIPARIFTSTRSNSDGIADSHRPAACALPA